MRVDIIDEMSAFEGLRENWDAVYAADPEATFYASHIWLRAWLDVFDTTWFVLAVRPNVEGDESEGSDREGGEYVAFLMIRLRAMFDKTRGFYNDIIFGGDQFSDYNAILCRPEFETQALPALAKHIREKLNWAEFRLDNWRQSDRRKKLFLEGFDKLKFKRKNIPTIERKLNLNHDICPYIDLPDDWEAYLASVSSNNRQKIRRLLRKVEASDEYRITVATDETYDRDLKALLDMWRVKWAPTKKDRTEAIIARNHLMLTRCAEQGRLFLPTFWHGDRAVAALATLVDDVGKRYLFVITGRDETYDEVPPGFILQAFSIRHAIEAGARVYDFLRGNEPYKYLFGVKEATVETVLFSTNGKRNLKGVLDPRPVRMMIDRAFDMGKKRQWADAELAYAQILELDPENALAQYRYGKVLARLGKADAAMAAFARSVEINPEGDNAWLELAQAREAAGDLAGALEAGRRAVALTDRNKFAANLVWRLEGQQASTPSPDSAASLLKPVGKPPALDLIAAATQKRSGFDQKAFDPGPRVNLDPRILQGPPPRR